MNIIQESRRMEIIRKLRDAYAKRCSWMLKRTNWYGSDEKRYVMAVARNQWMNDWQEYLRKEYDRDGAQSAERPPSADHAQSECVQDQVRDRAQQDVSDPAWPPSDAEHPSSAACVAGPMAARVRR